MYRKQFRLDQIKDGVYEIVYSSKRPSITGEFPFKITNTKTGKFVKSLNYIEQNRKGTI